MNKLKLALITLFLCFTTFCSSLKKDNPPNASIEIFYLKGVVDTRTPINCGTITKTKPSFRKVDTVLTEKQRYIEIVNQVKLLREQNKDSSGTSNCDVRIQCKINHANGDSTNFCIGEFNCLVKNGQRMEKNDTLIYLIRKHSGYYNYFSKEDLAYFDELKHFGIPNDYKDLRRVNSLDSIPLSPQ